MMKLRKQIGFWLTGVSLTGMLAVGCTQQRNPNQISADPQTPSAATEVQTEVETTVPYVPTPDVVVARMLELANVSGDDILYDLGSGDGRIPITAAEKYGTRSTGVEINPELVERSRDNAETADVENQVEFLQQDLFQTDLSDATVVTLYLLPDVNLQLRSKLLQELQPGTRIVSHDFDMGEWEPERVVRVQGPTREHTLYYWIVPEEIPEGLN